MKHYEESFFIPAEKEEIFAYLDDHKNLSFHMNQSSLMMGEDKMETQIDEGKGQKIGSHIRMNGRVFGINVFLDEVVTIYEPPSYEEWQTVGKLNLLVINNYKLGFDIKPEKEGLKLRVYIDYNLPKSLKTYILGLLLGKCMRNGALNRC